MLRAQENRTLVLDLLTQLNNVTEDTSRITILNTLAKEFINSDAEKAAIYARQAITIGETIKFGKGLAMSYYLYGLCMYQQYQFDSTLFYYQKSLPYKDIEENLDNSASFENIVGMVYHIQSNFSEAIKHYKESLGQRSKLGDKKGSAYCYNNIGAVFYDQGNYEKALENYFKSLEINELLNDQVMIASTLANIGGIYEGQEKYDHALSFYKRANAIANQSQDNRILADTYRNLGGIYTQKNNYDSAFIVYQNALDIYTKINDIRGTVVVYNLIAQTHVKRFEKEKEAQLVSNLTIALEFYQKSIGINSQDLNDVDEMLLSYQGIGEVYLLMGQYRKAIDYLNKAKEMADEIESFSSLEVSHDKLSKAYAMLGDYKRAYQNHVLYKNWNDSLKSDQNVELLTQMSMQYEFDKQQKEQEFLAAQKELEYQQKQKRDKLVRMFILIGLFVVSVFSIQVFRSYQRKKRDNVLLEIQKAEIEKQKEEITDSIKYAKRIQTAILPSNQLAQEILTEHFILFRPRDIVSGDYYWMNKVGNKVIIAAADCTGHGVPGAFMSMLGVSFLNEIVNKNNTWQAHLILNDLRREVKRTLGQTGKEGEAKDGMDIALCVIDFEEMKLQYAGAYNPLYLFRAGELIEIKADKMPIGIYVKEKESFTNNELDLQKGDTFYIFSDGYADQFGGPTGGKFKSKPFKELLGKIQDKNMADQREILNKNIDDWRGDIDQVDDIIVLGIRV
jgi:serine phosphatase RsbU (regulator of sigma subunit)